MRTTFIFSSWFLLLATVLPVAAQEKLGYIDFQYIVSQLQAAQDVQSELQMLSGEWTSQIDRMRDSVILLEKDLETMSLTLTKSTRDMLEKKIQESKQKVTSFQEQKFSPISGELYKKQQELLQPLIDKVKKAIDNVRIREKYAVIFDISAGNPVSIDKKFDLTTYVIDELPAVGLTIKGQQNTSREENQNQEQNQNQKK